MFIVGIDIAKRSHEAIIIAEDGQVVRKAFSFRNNCTGYNLLLEQVRRLTLVKSQIVFAMESTAHYWLALYARRLKDGYTVGVGTVLAATILSEIGDITRFSSADKLLAYAGLDPSVKQSGEFKSNQNRMSKRGSPYLRRAIWLASTVAVHRDPMFQTYYEKKISEGLHYMNVIGHVSRKMTAVIFAVLRDGQPYQPILQSAG